MKVENFFSSNLKKKKKIKMKTFLAKKKKKKKNRMIDTEIQMCLSLEKIFFHILKKLFI